MRQKKLIPVQPIPSWQLSLAQLSPSLLSKYCPNSSQILSIYCANIIQSNVYTLFKYCTNIIQILFKYYPNIVQILSKYYSVNIQILSVSKHFLPNENSADILRYMASYKAHYISGSPIFAENFSKARNQK